MSGAARTVVPELRAGMVLISKYTGERYKVRSVSAAAKTARIQPEGGPVENWTWEGLHRDGYRPEPEVAS